MSDDGLPSILEVISHRVKVLQYVPKRSRSLWGRVLTSTFADVQSSNDLRSWTMLFMLTKCTLRKPEAKVVGGLAKVINVRLEQWLNGGVQALWDEAIKCTTSPATNSNSNSNSNTRRAIHLSRLGRYGNACNALVSEGLAPEDDITLMALKEKHPTAVYIEVCCCSFGQ